MVTDRIKARDVYCLCNPDSFLNTPHILPSSILQQDDFQNDNDDFTRRLREIKENNTPSNSYIEEDLSVNSNNVFSRDAYSQEEEEEEEEKTSDFHSEQRTTQQYHQSKSQMKNDEVYIYLATETNKYQQNDRQYCEKINEGVDNNQLLSCDQQFDREILDRCSYEIYKTLPPPPPPTCTPPAMKQKKQQSGNPCRHATNKNDKLSSSENMISGSRSLHSDGERRGCYDREEDSICGTHKINNLPSRHCPVAERREGNNSFEADGPLPPCRGTCNSFETATRKTSVQIFQDDSDDQVNMSPPILRGRREDNQPSLQSSFRSRQQKMNRIRIAALQIKESFREEADDMLDISNSLLSKKARNYLHGQLLKISVNDEIVEVKNSSPTSDSLANRRNIRVLKFVKKKMRSRAD